MHTLENQASLTNVKSQVLHKVCRKCNAFGPNSVVAIYWEYALSATIAISD